MDIHILHDGRQAGPYTEEAVHALLKQGSVLVNDLAWRPGMSEWMPLLDLLYPAATPPPPPPAAVLPPEPEPLAAEPATPRQQAFLRYLRIGFAPDLTREQATLLVNDAMENPKDPARLSRWNEERLQLHPELFAAELQARKANRPQRYLEIAQEQGAAYFEKVTKAHCQVLVGHLDVRFPNWDAYEHEAVQKYFFPALAEKFPQLVTAEGKGKFAFAESAPAARKTTQRSPVVARTLVTPGPGIPGSIARGVALGLIVLGGLWAAREYLPKKPAPAATPAPAASEAPAETPPPAEASAPATPAPADSGEKPAAETPAPADAAEMKPPPLKPE